MKDDDYLLTVKEAADELRISPHTLRSWVSQKKESLAKKLAVEFASGEVL